MVSRKATVTGQAIHQISLLGEISDSHLRRPTDLNSEVCLFEELYKE